MQIKTFEYMLNFRCQLPENQRNFWSIDCLKKIFTLFGREELGRFFSENTNQILVHLVIPHPHKENNFLILLQGMHLEGFINDDRTKPIEHFTEEGKLALNIEIKNPRLFDAINRAYGSRSSFIDYAYKDEMNIELPSSQHRAFATNEIRIDTKIFVPDKAMVLIDDYNPSQLCRSTPGAEEAPIHSLGKK